MILVTYASAHGSTREIAERIGNRLRQRGLVTIVAPVEDAEAPSGFDAVVLGSAIHNGRWLPEAESYISAYETSLRDVRPWMFSVSSVGATTSALSGPATWVARKGGPVPKNLPELQERLNARGHRAFAGVISPGDWGKAGALFLKLTRGRYGDFRDWDDIEAWADTIASSVKAAQLLPASA